jgi:predicted O-linked N-acetylglucosamine transferase (SPINDLY family)
VYLCCQNTFKYLPQHDRVLAGIARRVPESQFVFLVYNDVLSDALRARLSRAFRAAGLEADDHCLFHPRLPTYVDYWNLHLVSDVFLDSLDYSGFTTTMEAVACGMPIVTLPGRFCRGRQTYAILQQLGVTDTIARDEAGYVDIAVRLGCDRAWRAEVVQRMAEGHRSLFWDTRSVRAIEEFYRSAVQKAAAAGT